MDPVEEYTKIESYFIRQRNCLMLRGKFAPIYTDYYLHLMQHGLKNDSNELDGIFKELLAYFTLHLVSRPWAERHSWTIHLQEPFCNLYVTGDSINENVVGRIFTDNIKNMENNVLYSYIYKKDQPPVISTINLQSSMAAEWVEDFYIKSEQRMARCIELPDEEFVLIVAQPDADIEWLVEQDAESISKYPEHEELKLLETRKFKFFCGCTLDKIMPALSLWKGKEEDLFQGEKSVQISCPRCGAIYDVTKDMLKL